jgi:hypothetical protein
VAALDELYAPAMLQRTVLLTVLLVACAASAAHAGSLAFGPLGQLPNGDPARHPYWSGAEPSIAFDPSGDGHVYVSAPQFIPTAVDHAAGAGPDADVGAAAWGSGDHGLSWPNAALTGAANGGGDTDVEVADDHSVFVADLEAAATDICTSHDFGKTYQDCENGLAKNQQGPENDRQWLTRGPGGVLYLTYHDFAGGFPIIERSTDGGKSFAPCGTIIDPGGPAAQNYTPAGGTLVSKPVVGKDGSVYVEFTEPDATASPIGANLNHMYMAVAKGGCNGTTVFADHLVYEDPGADLASIFDTEAIDGGGQLYILLGGKLKAGEKGTNLYLFTSTDGGAHWTQAKVNPPDVQANVLPAIAGGQAKGQALLGWFGSASDDPNDTKAVWNYYAAATYDGGQTFNSVRVGAGPVHYGDICTQGIFCGLVPGQPSNRNLADFSSAAIDPATGCGALAVPSDPYNRPDQPSGANNFDSSAYVALQQGDTSCFTAANAGKAAGTVGGGAGTGSDGSGSGGGGCLDRVAPASRFDKARSASRRGVTLSGRSSDRGCAARGRGRVARVSVAIARRVANGKCSYLKASGRLGKPVSCARAGYLRATGTTRWRVRFAHRLPKGRYVAWARGIDAAGNVEHRAGSRNATRFSIR